MTTTQKTHPRRSIIAVVLLTLVLTSCGAIKAEFMTARQKAGCNSQVVLKSPEPIGIGDFANVTRPGYATRSEWLKLVTERNHFFSNEIKPGTVMILPRPCEKGEKRGTTTKPSAGF